MQSLFWFLIWWLLFGGLSAPMQPPLSGESLLPTVTPPSVPSQPSADAAIFLDFGTSTVVKDGALTLTFSDVVEDSRCPANVSCGWSGMVVVELDAEVNGRPVQTLQIGGMTDYRGSVVGSVPARQVTDVATVGSYKVQVLSVTPYPAKAETLPNEAEYQVQLTIDSSTTAD
jgi:hypothetical protein